MTQSATVFEETTPEDGVVRFEKWPEGYVLWYHGEVAWRSAHPPLAAQPPDDVREALTDDPTPKECHRLARECITYGIERADRDWHTDEARDAARQMATELLETFDHYLPSHLFAASPTPPDDVAEGMVTQAYRDADFLCGAASLNPNTAWEARMLAASELMRKLARALKSGSGQ